MQTMLRGLNGRGHLKTIFIFLRGRALNKDIGNIQILRQRYLDFFFTNEKFMVNFIIPKILRPIGWLLW